MQRILRNLQQLLIYHFVESINVRISSNIVLILLQVRRRKDPWHGLAGGAGACRDVSLCDRAGGAAPLGWGTQAILHQLSRSRYLRRPRDAALRVYQCRQGHSTLFAGQYIPVKCTVIQKAVRDC